MEKSSIGVWLKTVFMPRRFINLIFIKEVLKKLKVLHKKNSIKMDFVLILIQKRSFKCLLEQRKEIFIFVLALIKESLYRLMRVTLWQSIKSSIILMTLNSSFLHQPIGLLKFGKFRQQRKLWVFSLEFLLSMSLGLLLPLLYSLFFR